MEKIITSIAQLKEINCVYDIPTDQIDDLQKLISETKVCIPIIGKFSSGKSALVNTLLGYQRKILKEDIMPETAIPAELNYSEINEVVYIIRNDGITEQIAVEEYRDFKADANTVQKAKLYLENSFLKKIPDVMLVDMPGFESGFEIHNKAIDSYLPNSLAYIITIPADDMNIRNSIGNILKELCLRDMPICIVITKYDKRNDEFDNSFNVLKENLKRYIGDKDIAYCFTSAFIGDAESLETYLENIQKKAQDLLSDYFALTVISIAEKSENYLKTVLKNNELSESELIIKEEELQKKLQRTEERFSAEKNNFDLEINDCVKEIIQDVQYALENEENTLVVMLLNKHDIKEHLNQVIRNTVTVSVQNKLVTRVEKYLNRIADCFNSDDICDDVTISVNISMEKLNKSITTAIVSCLTGFILGPIIAIITGVFLHFHNNKEKEEKRQTIKSELRNNTFPRIISEIENNINHEITRIIIAINSSIEKDYNDNKNNLLKSLEDLKNRINEENRIKENNCILIRESLDRIIEIKEHLS